MAVMSCWTLRASKPVATSRKVDRVPTAVHEVSGRTLRCAIGTTSRPIGQMKGSPGGTARFAAAYRYAGDPPR